MAILASPLFPWTLRPASKDVHREISGVFPVLYQVSPYSSQWSLEIRCIFGYIFAGCL
jgi:hypothetical protein